MLTRRLFLRGGGGLVLAGAGTAAYACGVEPGLRLVVTSYRLTPPGWPADLRLRCAIVADIHACDPWMSVGRIRDIVAVTNALAPDVTLLLGDFNAGHDYVTGIVWPQQWGEQLAGLQAPLGSYAILGNHDWWHGALPSMKGDGAEAVRRALKQAGATVLENDSVALSKEGRRFWLAGLADQMAVRTGHKGHYGLDDLGGTLAQVTDDAPVILLAHEPYVFSRVPDRVSLTMCGHTHGGQVNLPVLSDWWNRHELGTSHVYGHIVERGRHMIISAGLGTSIAPVRFMRPPEIVLLELGGDAAPAA